MVRRDDAHVIVLAVCPVMAGRRALPCWAVIVVHGHAFRSIGCRFTTGSTDHAHPTIHFLPFKFASYRSERTPTRPPGHFFRAEVQRCERNERGFKHALTHTCNRISTEVLSLAFLPTPAEENGTLCLTLEKTAENGYQQYCSGTLNNITCNGCGEKRKKYDQKDLSNSKNQKKTIHKNIQFVHYQSSYSRLYDSGKHVGSKGILRGHSYSARIVSKSYQIMEQKRRAFNIHGALFYLPRAFLIVC